MSNIEQEAFEKRNPVPEDAVWSERKQGYYWSNYPNVNHPFNNDWMIWEEAIEWQAARQAPASGEVEPVARIDRTRRNTHFTPMVENAHQLPEGVYYCYTHPPAKVPEGWSVRRVDDRITVQHPDFGGYCADLNADDKSQIAPVILYHLANALLTTPTPATTAGAEWVKCEDRLPKDESTVLAYAKDYADPMVVPARYSPNSEQWFDVEYVDRDGDQNTLYQVISWMPLPTPPQEQ